MRSLSAEFETEKEMVGVILKYIIYDDKVDVIEAMSVKKCGVFIREGVDLMEGGLHGGQQNCRAVLAEK